MRTTPFHLALVWNISFTFHYVRIIFFLFIFRSHPRNALQLIINFFEPNGVFFYNGKRTAFYDCWLKIGLYSIEPKGSYVNMCMLNYGGNSHSTHLFTQTTRLQSSYRLWTFQMIDYAWFNFRLVFTPIWILLQLSHSFVCCENFKHRMAILFYHHKHVWHWQEMLFFEFFCPIL